MSPVPGAAHSARTRELLSDGARRSLLVAILNGTLVAGERLHDDELIQWLGVSRTPIRTALERLAEVGLVEMAPNRFTRVAVPTRSSLLETLQLYAALHAWVAEAVVPGLGDDDLAELHRCFGRVTELAAQQGEHAWSRADLALVDEAVSFFAHRTGNPLLLDLLFEIRVRLAFSFSSLRAFGDGAELTALAEALLAAADRRDGRVVADVLRERLSWRIVRVGGSG
ncbi:GntR family transcriptional regulator [Frondihabitans sp. VKM Ac-2883]|uniref:GntR family transcriptional regulator n=1 Tax=Frondihabitans sp. VKM Ac-2883 TaxID=2783823 RepID=UPI00351C84AD